jgi:transcriptional regulator with XRE-family HTH domain
MDDVKLGSIVRAVRIRAHRTQAAVAAATSVPRGDVSRLERGKLDDLRVGTVRRILGGLEMGVEIKPSWRGPELERLVNKAHAALQEAVLAWFGAMTGWVALPEVTYSIYGERGAIDILAWHAPTRSLLIIELKTVLVEAADLARTMDKRVRLARRIVQAQGWRPRTVSSWVILTDTRTNRRRVGAHRETLAQMRRLDGHGMRRWVGRPDGQVAALSFWDVPAAIVERRVGTPRAKREPSEPTPADAGVVPAPAEPDGALPDRRSAPAPSPPTAPRLHDG